MTPLEKYMTEIKGFIGVGLSTVLPILTDLNTIIQTGGALLGILLLIASIKNRLLEKKKNEIEIKILENKLNEIKNEDTD